jgi:hypothetical protein
MATYVYGIVRRTARSLGGKGIGSAQLRRITIGDTAALVSELPGDLRLGRSEVLVHGRVLERALARGTVLPMRFGVTMDGDESVRVELLARHAQALGAQLEALDGKVEIRIRGVYDQDILMREIVRENGRIARMRKVLRGVPAAAAYYDTIELGGLVAAAVERKRRQDTVDVLDALAPTAVAIDVGKPAHERVVLSASFLVERRKLHEFDETLLAVADRQGGRMRFNYVGPLPPYSFVELPRKAA